MALKWRGAQLKARLKAAQVKAVDATMAASVTHAKQNHPWRNRTGSAERSISIVKPASATSTGAVGTWGSTDIQYFRRLELGFQGRDRLGRVYNQGPLPSLRPAAQAEYPLLAARIRAML